MTTRDNEQHRPQRVSPSHLWYPQEENRVHGALYALRILARKYEFRDEDDRLPIIPVIGQV